MRRLRDYGLTASGAAVLLAVLLLASGPQLRATMHTLVEVINTPSQPVPTFDVQNPACMPFQTTVFIGFPSGQGLGKNSFTVPSNKRLVIEHVSASSHGRGFIRLHLNTTVNGVFTQHFLVMHYQGPTDAGNQQVFNTSQPARWYADPGSTVEFTGGIVPANGANITIGVSGYLVDCTPGRTSPPGTP